MGRVRATVDEGDQPHDSSEYRVGSLLLRGRVHEHDRRSLFRHLSGEQQEPIDEADQAAA
jgi:hypothetical protein